MLAVAVPGVAPAQRADSARAAVGVAPASSAKVRTDSALTPPISPRRAFLTSFLLPGAGQAALGRPQAGALYAGIEILALGMARKSGYDLREAKQFAHDSIVERYEMDTQGLVVRDSLGDPKPIFARNRFAGNRVQARRTHYEDWIALLFFNHLFSGADAFVAAQLWELPARVELRAMPGGAVVSVSRRW